MSIKKMFFLKPKEPHKTRGIRGFYLLGVWTVIFFLSLAFSSTLYAQIRKWGFENQEDYRFDPQKIQVSEKQASLKKKILYKDKGRIPFDLGTYDENTWATNEALELIPQSSEASPENFLPAPVDEDTAGLMALWHLDEPSGTNILDAVGKNVAKTNDTEMVSGQTGFNYARLFDGVKSHVFIPDYDTFNFKGPFSVESWIRPVSPVKGKVQALVSRWQTIGSQKSFALQISSEGKLDFQVSRDGSISTRVTGETVLSPGHWYHAVGVYTGNELRVYLNGALDTQPVTFTGPVFQTNIPLYLGALIDNKMKNFFDGVLDEVAFYSKALSETQAMNHFGNPQALVGSWHLDERAGILSDSSGYGHSGIAHEHPEYGVEGKKSSGMRFAGSKQFLEITPSHHFSPEGQLTLEMWVKPEKLPGKGEVMPLVSNFGGQADYSVSLVGPLGKMHAASSLLSPPDFTGQHALMPNEWHHVAVTWGQGRLSIYVDGVLDSSASYSGELRISEKSDLVIGTDSARSSWFQGVLDDVAIYRRVKNKYEIAADANLFPPSGIYVSKVKDAGSQSPWQTLSWQPLQSYGKQIQKEEKGMLHLYHLDEPSGSLFQDEMNETPANAMGTYAVPGVFSQARWFSKKGYDKIISQKTFPSLSTFTISLWFQFKSSEPQGVDRIFSVGDENPSLYRSAPDGRLHVVSTGARKIVSDVAILDSRWHHAALTSDGHSLFLYLDGDLSGSSPFVRATAAEPLIIGNLKSSDTFEGAVDEFAFFNYGLDKKTITDEYLSAKLDTKFLVRTSESESFTNSEWRGPQGPAASEIRPSESTVALWHFNEKNLQGSSNEVADDSRYANHGVAYGHGIASSEGVISRGIYLNGASDFIEVADSESLHLHDAFTLSAWIRPEEVEKESSRIIDKHYAGGAPIFSSFSLELLSGNRLGVRLGHEGGYHLESSDQDGQIGVGRWNYVAATWNGKEIRLYINGSLVKKASFHSPIFYDKGALYLGRYGSGAAGFFHGGIDEALIAAEALSDHEVANLFFKTNPENAYRGISPQKLEVAPGRYFQYLALLKTEDAAVGPTIKSVSVQGNDYSVDKPAIINNKSVSFAAISDFRERLGTHHKGMITYQISRDGSNWYYHNGRHWVVAASIAESNTAAQVAQRIYLFPSEVGIGSFYFKAFLHSPSGVEPVELESLELEYLPNKLTVTSPNGGEGWLVGSPQTLQWNSAGEVAAVNLEYSRDDFKKDFHSIVKDFKNAGSYKWTVPDTIDPMIKIRVMDALDPRIYDTSDITFRIMGAFEVSTPNYRERWEVGSKQDIIWKALGSMFEVKLDYSTDEFKNQIYPIVDSMKNEGTYHWTIPDHISKTAKVRISDVRDFKTMDISNDAFTIHGRLQVVYPEAHARFQVGSNQGIRWKTLGSIPAIKLQYAVKNEEGEQEWKKIENVYPNHGDYVWPVPDQIDQAVTIRVSDPNDDKVFSDSSKFIIMAAMEILNPKGGEYWTVGSRRKIAWKTTGTVSSVNLEYTSIDRAFQKDLQDGKLALDDKAFKWNLIEKGLTNIGSYAWVVPDSLTENAVIRVTDAGDPQAGALCRNPFRIIPGFVLQTPNGSEAWAIASEHDIEWETKGSMQEVRLEYSKDAFVKDAHTLIDRASNIGRFSWKLPDDASPKVWVRVSDPDTPQASDISDVPFRLYGTFEFSSPLGGEKYEVGTLASIQWETKGNIPQVKLEYSHDNFNKDARVIAPSILNHGQYTWTVPDDIGSGYYFRISDPRDPQAAVISDGVFSVVGKFYLLTPVGGENLVVGTVQNITWKGAGSVAFIRIDYSEDDFTKSFVTLAEATANNGIFKWEIPNKIGQGFKLRIWDPSHPESMYVMAHSSRIIGGFMLDSPNGGESLYVGEPFDVSWKTSGNVDRVKLDFSDDNFTKRIWEISDTVENLEKYLWKIPDMPAGLYKLRISDPRDSYSFDISNSDFRIRSRVTLMSPKGGEGWAVGEKHAIQWKTSGMISKVKIEYSTDDFKSSSTIAEAVPNTGVYEWTVPNYVAQSIKFRISDVSDPGARVVSTSTMKTQAILSLTTPRGGEVWHVGQTYPILWKSSGEVKGVKIEYSRDGFISEAKTIIPSTPNQGIYNWTVPDEISRHTKIRVMDLTDSQTQVMSKTPFQIAGSFQMMGPNGQEIWHALEKREISWVSVGTMPEVDLSFCAVQNDAKEECSNNHDDNRFVIDKGVVNSGRYVWDIPRLVGEKFKVKVCDSQNPEICDESDHPFALNSPFEIVYPRGAEIWPVGSDQEIRWHTYGNVARVLIQYATPASVDSITNGKKITWKTLAEGLDNQEYFLFKIPDDISKNVIFKLADWDDEELYSATSHPVMFAGTFTLLIPNGGEKWAAGATQKIVWDTLGSVPNARLEFSTDNFDHDVNVIESSYTNTGNYPWTLPPALGKAVTVRISDASNPKAFDLSDKPFKIMPGFVMISPDGNEVWKVGSKQKISWKTIGGTEKIRLQYATGLEWKNIVDRIANGGSFEWMVPNDVSKAAKVRVINDSDLDAWDASNAPFEIRPDIIVTSPNGEENFFVGQPAEIRWVSIGSVGALKMEYSKDGFVKDVHPIAQDVSDKSPFVWTPGDDITQSAVIRVISQKNDKVRDGSDHAFSILPKIQVLKPKAGDMWKVGSEHAVEWDWRGTLDKVNVEYSTNDFMTTSVIARDLPNTGKVSWTIPDQVNEKIRIRVMDAAHSASLGISPSFLKVVPGYGIIHPNGGEPWKVGQRETIQWKTFGTSPRVILQYGIFTDKGPVEWKDVTRPIQNKGEFSWEIPADVSSQVKMRVLDTQDSQAVQISEKPFKILAQFPTLSPKPSQNLFVADKFELKWKTLGNVPSVKLEFSAADENSRETNQFELIESDWANRGNYFWTVPDTINEAIRLKISDAREPDSFTLSEPFRIRGRLTGKISEGQINWPVGTAQTIFWKSVGSIEQVDLSYQLPEQNDWKVIIRGIPNTGSYGWKIPDDVAQKVKLRVADSNNSEVFDELKDKITIAARLEFKEPKAGEILEVGATQEISWNTFGKIQRAWLEYSANGGGWIPVAGPVPDSGSFEWTVPDAISSTARLRIRDGDNDAAFAISSNFQIRGGLSLTSPNGGEVWGVGNSQVIEWKTTGTIPKIKLEFLSSTLLGTGQQVRTVPNRVERQIFLIKDGVVNQNRFECVIPNRIANDVSVRVTDVRDPQVYSESKKPFSVIGTFRLISPQGSEVWIVGSSQSINWMTQGSVPKIRLEYSRDDFYRDINAIVTEAANTGMLTWKIPNMISDQVTLRILNAEDSRAQMTLTKPFKIAGALAMKLPGSNETWTVGELKELIWTTTGTIPQIRIEFSRDNFQKDVQVIENVWVNKNRYEWKVPDVISSSARFRVANANDAKIYALTNPLKIQGRIHLSSPQLGEALTVRGHCPIRWETTGTIPKVRLEYSRDNFRSDVQMIAPKAPNSGLWDWQIPDDVGAGVKVRATDLENAQVYGESEKPFKILAQFSLASPKPGQNLFVSDKFEMKWQTLGHVPSVKLEFSSTDQTGPELGKYELIESYWANHDNYFWTVPDKISETIRFKISDAQEPDSVFISEPFHIRGRLNGRISEGQINWPVGTSQTIFWKSVGSIAQVSLSYRLPEQKGWKPIARGIPNTGSYGWQIPDDVAKEIKIRISDSNNSEVLSELKEKITIAARFEFKEPKAGEISEVGSIKEIAWNTLGKIQRTWLEYSVGGENWAAIAGPVQDLGGFKWTVPDSISSTARLRIRDGDNNAAFAVSPNFQIRGRLDLVTPSGAEVWGVGQSQVIEWKTTGTIPQIKLEFLSSTLLGTGQQVRPVPNRVERQSFLIKEDAANQNRFEWFVPNQIADDIKVRISDARDPQVFSESKQPFSIIGTFGLISPKGDEVWGVGSTQPIAWISRGDIPKVHVEYSRDDFYRDINVIVTQTPNAGMLMWKIPDVIADHVTIRISDAEDPRAVTTSLKSFKITGALAVTLPTQNETWTVGEPRELTWTTTGTIPQVRIEFSRDDFQKDIQVIENRLANKNRYEWKVPDVISTSLKFRILNAKDAQVAAMSNPVKIQGRIQLTTLQSHEILTVLGHRELKWETMGTVPKVRIEYSRDNFHSDIHIIASNVLNTGLWDWQIPDDIGAGVKVRVMDEFNFSVADATPQSLDIQGALTLMEEVDQPRFVVGSKRNVMWNTTGTIPVVRLEYFKEDGVAHPVLIADALKNKGNFFWNVPDDISDRIRLRVSDIRTETIFGVSQTPIPIVGALSLLEPKAGVAAQVAARQAVRWSTVGTIPQIRLEYSVSDPAQDKEGNTLWNLVTGSVDNQGIFQWMVPNDISNTVRIRVSDARDPLVNSISGTPFAIQGGIQLFEPHGRERWIVDTKHEIVWNSVGTLPQVKIEYSRDQFQKDIHLIQDQVANTGHLMWTVPDDISDKVKIRVSSATDPRVASIHKDPISIMGDFVFLEPEGNPIWNVGSEQKIEWQTIGTVPQVKLEYMVSTKEAMTSQEFHTIQTGIPNQGSFLWTIPDKTNSKILIRVSDARDATVATLSQKQIKIIGSFKFHMPESAENWLVGETRKLQWDTLGTISRIDLEVSADNFQEKSIAIEKAGPNDNAYAWKVPDLIAKQVVVKIINSEDPSVFAVSDPFEIRGGLRVLQPAGNQTFQVGEKQTVEWKTVGSIPAVDLEFSTDQFVSDRRKIGTISSQSGHYDWIIPDAISDHLWMRVSDAKDSAVQSMTIKPFKISGHFELLNPKGGEIFFVEGHATLNWKTIGTIPSVHLEFSRDGFRQDRQTIIRDLKNEGLYEWLVPDAMSDQIWVRVVNAADASVVAGHEAPVKIQGKLALLKPAGEEIWKVGSEQSLQWKSVGSIAEVRLEYSNMDSSLPTTQRWTDPSSGGRGSEAIGAIYPEIASLLARNEKRRSEWLVIQDHLPNHGIYLWRLPDNLPSSIRVRVVDVSNSVVFSESASPVKIEGTLRMIFPDKKEKWQVGSKKEIVWESRGSIHQVKIEYSTDSFRHDSHVINSPDANSGRYLWEIPDLVTQELTVRISDAQNPDVQTLSPFPIAVVGRLRLETPQGGERWEAGSHQEISWATLGTIAQVNLEYSKDQFIRHRQPISQLLPNTGHYLWKVPDDISSSIWVRVADSMNLSVEMTSEQALTIAGSFFLKRPSAGQIWTVGNTETLEWDTNGGILRVRLEYSTDDFVSSTPMSAVTPNVGRYEWKIPDVVSNQLKVRVLDAQDDHVYATSASPVKIQGALNFISPVAQDFWVSGAEKAISWSTHGMIPYVTLEYSDDNFSHATPVIIGLANSGNYNWTVPDLATNEMQLRIMNAQDQSVLSLSPVFHIGGTLQLLSPAGGEIWKVGETQEIKWKTSGSIPKVKIDLSSDQFHRDIQTLTAAWDNAGAYSWTVPDMIRSQAQIRISDTLNAGIFDTSKAPFKISGTLTLVRPQGGESWKVGSRPVITWKTTGTIAVVQLEYSVDDFKTTLPMVMETPNTGSYEWQVPDLAGNEIKVRVSSIHDASVFTDMNYATQIEGGLKLEHPSGGEVFAVGSQQMVLWRTIGTIPNVNLEYSEDDFATVKAMAMGTPNRGSYLWSVPSLNTRNLKIRITDSVHPNIFDVMAQALEVLGDIQIVNPVGGEIFLVGSELPIRWTSVGKIDQVRIECSTDNYKNLIPVVNAVPNTGEFLWKVPDAVSRKARIRIVDVNHPTVKASVMQPFEIRGVLSLVSPVGGEVWSVNENYPISWQTLGTIPQVRLEYSRDNFEHDLQVIAPNLSNKGVYHWDVPATVGGDIHVRVVDNANPDTFDVTQAPVRIVGKIDLIYPVLSETFQVGERVDFQWRSSPNIGTVKIEYSTNNFETTEIISSAAPNRGKFSWNVPDKIGDSLKIRVSDSQNATVFSVSKDQFRIRGALKLMYPAGGEVWSVGSTQHLAWSTGGTVPEVRLEYSGDDFVTARPIVSTTPNTGAFDWKIPEMTDRNIRVRVTYLGDKAVQSASLGSVRILGQIRIISPSGGERWIANEERTIRWQTLGSVPRVTLEYSKDDFLKDIHLIDSDIPNIGSQFWTVPNDRSSQVRIRIRSHQDPEVDAVSSAPFQIDHYHIRWVIKDTQTQDHLAGLVLTDSAGQTQTGLTSPVTIERPYGIYTTVWSKPGYKEFKSTWVADNDRSFAVMLERSMEAFEQPRVNFQYDAEKDLMKITSWFERDGKIIPAVIYSEVRIYEGARLLYTLNSSNPDTKGYFHMVWDTNGVEGNARYLASASVTLANSKMVSSPISFQLDIPVKRDKILSNRVFRHTVLQAPQESQSSNAILSEAKNLSTNHEQILSAKQPGMDSSFGGNSAQDDKQSAQGDTKKDQSVPKKNKSEDKSQGYSVPKLMAPDRAILRETISIQYLGAAASRPIIDVYDSAHLLIVHGKSMHSESEPGRFSYMLPISGLGFIPGKSITVSVIERKTGRFATQKIMIESTSTALGLSHQVGETTVLEILHRLDKVLTEIKEIDKNPSQVSQMMHDFEQTLLDLGSTLNQETLNKNLLNKLNKIAVELNQILSEKGFDGSFLIQNLLEEHSDLGLVHDKVRQFNAAIEMLGRLYHYNSVE
ncbi:MAG: hypothetical protein EXS63_03185 [Candidatus Omnitrophica bacterium]|nr:hypothetical protein [Candidatus Omnitrophota bacterium]